MATRRKKKEPEPQELIDAATFTVGAPPSPDAEEPPSLSVDTIEDLLALRAHLEQRIPSPGLLWPLRALPSMSQHMSDVESAAEAVDRLAVRHAMSNAKLAELRRFLLEDAYANCYLVCRHREIDPNVHMALAYAAAGQAGKLAWCITQSGFEGYVIDRFREACKSRSIDPSTIEGVYKLDQQLDWVNFRLPRGTYKSSVITHTGIVVTVLADPNTANKITAAIDDKAFELCEQVGETLRSGLVQDIFPDRVPAKSDCSQKKITVPGRTVSSREKTVHAGGYLSKNETGGHFNRHWIDDLVVGGKNGNANPTQLPGAINWLVNLPNQFIINQRTRVVHAGTKWARGDDHDFLARSPDCVSIVVPIEIYPDGRKSIFERGIPTMPTFYPTEKIQWKQNRTLADGDGEDAIESWLCNNLLESSPRNSSLFDEGDLNDPDRIWLGPFEHPKAKLRGGDKYAHRFYVGRIARNADGVPVDKDEKPLDVKAEGWRANAKTRSFDPWEDMDMVLTLDGTWSDGGQRWAVTAAGVDCDLVAYQFETRSGDDGVTGWTRALAEMNKTYEPRIIGMDKKSYADPVVQNLFTIDPEMRKLRGKLRSVDQSDTLQESRVRAGVAEPLKSYRLMLLAPSDDPQGDYGAAKTRKDMLRYRPGSEMTWPVLDSLAMILTIARKVMSREDREKMTERQKAAEARYKQAISKVTGVPLVA